MWSSSQCSQRRLQFSSQKLGYVASETPLSHLKHSFSKICWISLMTKRCQWLAPIIKESFLWVFLSELLVKVIFNARSSFLCFFPEDWKEKKSLFWWWPEKCRSSLKWSVTAEWGSTQKKANVSAELGTRKVMLKVEILYKKKTKLNSSKAIRAEP